MKKFIKLQYRITLKTVPYQTI